MDELSTVLGITSDEVARKEIADAVLAAGGVPFVAGDAVAAAALVAQGLRPAYLVIDQRSDREALMKVLAVVELGAFEKAPRLIAIGGDVIAAAGLAVERVPTPAELWPLIVPSPPGHPRSALA
ncbi:MAG TPA: hypothetical protein VGF45_06520 [Polyangia bacterium]